MNKIVTPLCAVFLALAGIRALAATPWPGFRGPDGSGIAPADAKPAMTWSDGRNLEWKAALPGPGFSSPILWGDRVFVTCYSGYGDGSGEGSPENLRRHLICLEPQTGKILWSSRTASYVPTPVLHGGRLYVVNDQGFAVCMDAKTGKLVYKERLPGASSSGRGARPVYASPVLANGHIYAVSRRNGTFVLKPEPEFSLVTHNKLAGDKTDFNATPALSGRQLFLRSNRMLYCIEPMQTAGAEKAQ